MTKTLTQLAGIIKVKKKDPINHVVWYWFVQPASDSYRTTCTTAELDQFNGIPSSGYWSPSSKIFPIQQPFPDATLTASLFIPPRGAMTILDVSWTLLKFFSDANTNQRTPLNLLALTFTIKSNGTCILLLFDDSARPTYLRNKRQAAIIGPNFKKRNVFSVGPHLTPFTQTAILQHLKQTTKCVIGYTHINNI